MEDYYIRQVRRIVEAFALSAEQMAEIIGRAARAAHEQETMYFLIGGKRVHPEDKPSPYDLNNAPSFEEKAKARRNWK